MKKSYAAWAVLLAIALVASFLLGLTNEVTKDTIAEQQVARAEASRQALQPEADSFEQLELEEGSGLDSLYEAKKNGETIGLVATVLTQGFGGEVEVTAGFNKEAALTGISVGGANFAETPGLGAKTKDPAFTDQFQGKTPRLKLIKADGEKGDNTVDAITAATRTSTAVTNAVNTAGEYVKTVLGIGGEEETVVAGSRTAKASAQGFGGLVAVELTLDDQDKISEITIGDDEFAETEGIGAKALEPEVAQALVGLTPPLAVADVDILAGATVTKTALVEAVNKAAQMVKDAAGTPSVKVSEQGFGGLVAVVLTLDEEGKIAALNIGDDEFAETEGIGAKALEPEVAQAFVGLTPPLAVADVDVLAGATITKTAIVNAINKGAEKLSGAAAAPADQPEAAEAPEATEIPATEAPAATEAPTEAPAAEASAPAEAAPAAEGITVSAKGLTGSFPVTVVLNDDGTVKAVTLGESDSENDKPFLAMVNNEVFLNQFAGKAAPVEGIDAVTGATTSSNAIVAAVNEAAASAAPAAEAPKEEEKEAPAEEAPAAEGVTVSAKGLTGSFPVTVALNDDGTVKAVTLGESDSENDKAFLAMVNNEAFLGQFAGQAAPVEGIDAVTGATTSSNAIVAAVNEAAASAAPAAEAPKEEEKEAPAEEAPAAEGITVSAKGLTGSFPVTVALNEDGTVKAVTLGESDSENDKAFLAMVNNEAFLGQFAGKAAPVEGIDAVTGATTSSNAIVAAVNEAAAPAAEASKEEEKEAPAEEAPAAEGITVSAKGLTGSFPVTVTLNEEGTVKAVTLGESDSENDKPFLAMVNNEDFLNQFAGKAAPVEGIDAVTGATTSSNAIVAAVNEALAQAQ